MLKWHFRESRSKNFPGEHALGLLKNLCIYGGRLVPLTLIVGGPSKMLNRGPPDITLRHWLSHFQTNLYFLVLKLRIILPRFSQIFLNISRKILGFLVLRRIFLWCAGISYYRDDFLIWRKAIAVYIFYFKNIVKRNFLL
jgi:hypothetical protein